MMTRNQECQIATVCRSPESCTQFLDQHDAARLVPHMAWQFGRRCQPLAEIVQKYGKAYRQAIALLCGMIECHHDMHAGIDFRMEIGTLRHAEQTIKLG